MTELNPYQDGVYQNSEAGSIASLSDRLFDEYGLMGYSLTPDDILTAIVSDMTFYAGWEATSQQTKGVAVTINAQYVITFDEWAVIEPVVRAHCDFIQAQRVEGTGSLGGERFGLSVGEASQNYINAKEVMKKEAFIEPPFTFGFGD